jgi:phage gp46-like protein
MSDVLIEATPDGGDMQVNGGNVGMTNDLRTSVYLSLTTQRSWADGLEENVDKRFTGHFMDLFGTLPITTGNLIRFEDAAKRDLQWVKKLGYAQEIVVSATAESVKRIYLKISINGVPYEYPFEQGAV